MKDTNRLPSSPTSEPIPASDKFALPKVWLQEIRTPHGRTPEAQRKNAECAISLVEELVRALRQDNAQLQYALEQSEKAFRKSRVPASDQLREALEAAMQGEWDDFCTDTGCHPDFIYSKGRKIFADFRRGNFAPRVAAHIERLIVQERDTLKEHGEIDRVMHDNCCRERVALSAELASLRVENETYQQRLFEEIRARDDDSAELASLRSSSLTAELIERLEIIHTHPSDGTGRRCSSWNNDPEDCDCEFRESNMKILALRSSTPDKGNTK